MIFLQVDSTLVVPEIVAKVSLWHYIEIAAIIGVIVYQLKHSIKVHSDTLHLKSVFEIKLFLRNGFVEKNKIGTIDFDSTDIHYEDTIDFNDINEDTYDNIVKIALVDTEGKHPIIRTIKEAINTYLINNYGAAVNFSIIKDIIDREVEVKDDEISQSVSLPLYLGLAATMIGIIFGFFSMPELDGAGFTTGINALIDGVKIAMFGSFIGLACTTYLSSFSYKKAHRIVQKEKNEQLTYLQAKLLPELLKAEDTGVSGLKASLDRFARVATTIADNVLIAANQTGENLELQKGVIEKVGNMEMLKVSKWNFEMFEKLENNMDAFNHFSNYLSRMELVTSQLIEFGKKTSDVNNIISSIDSTLGESRDLTRFLSSHFEKIENSGAAALKSVGIVESHFEEAIKSLQERTEGMINQLFKSAGNHEESIEKIYEVIEQNLNTITSQYVDAFKDAYSDSIPKFNQLDNLELMKGINESLNGLAQNQSLMNKLNSIEETLNKRTTRNNGTNVKVAPQSQKNDIGKTKEPLTIREVFKKLF